MDGGGREDDRDNLADLNDSPSVMFRVMTKHKNALSVEQSERRRETRVDQSYVFQVKRRERVLYSHFAMVVRSRNMDFPNVWKLFSSKQR